ncbi:MAG: inorganic diphosphatase [Bacteroidota bacterium]
MKFVSCTLFIFLSIGCKNTVNEHVDYTSIPPINPDSTVNMIVEIPAGTTAKYEMSKTTHQLVMDSIDNLPRYINYLGYPGNYGMIPNTLLAENMGGDGDPLDILLLGPSAKRGSIHKVSVIGVLELLDNRNQDDKLIAIDPESQWKAVEDASDLDSLYPGTKTIISTFFESYKGKGKMQLKGWADKRRAKEVLLKSLISK